MTANPDPEQGEIHTIAKAAAMSQTTVQPFNQESWDQWQARGRASDAAVSNRVRLIALAVASIGLFAATLWTLT